jgi:DNA-binding transcriptional ArsR family regulator
MVVRSGRARHEDAGRVDRLFHALSDPTRRDIIRIVLDTEQSVSALAQRYPMSFAAVQKHVAVLDRAALVTKRRKGREQMVRGDIEALRAVNTLLDQYEGIWRSRIDQMDEILAGDTEPGASGATPRKPTNKEMS